MYTDLTYVNCSFDRHCPRVVLVQKNQVKGLEQWAVAWKVIRNCGFLCWHPFRFDWRLALEVADAHGNRSDRIIVENGGQIAFVRESSGRGRLVRETVAEKDVISVINRTQQETFSANLYRGERLLAFHPLLHPSQKAKFQFNRTVLIGTSLRRREGEAVELARLMGPPSEIDLSGIRKGRIVMTGGGHGPSAQPLRFWLDKEERW